MQVDADAVGPHRSRHPAVDVKPEDVQIGLPGGSSGGVPAGVKGSHTAVEHIYDANIDVVEERRPAGATPGCIGFSAGRESDYRVDTDERIEQEPSIAVDGVAIMAGKI